jgi:hypothetical protein
MARKDRHTFLVGRPAWWLDVEAALWAVVATSRHGHRAAGAECDQNLSSTPSGEDR